MEKLLQDRRSLLRFVLRELQDSGREVLLPVGCADFDDWLLDALAVDRLIRQINSGSPALDLIQACAAASTARKALSPPRPGPSASTAEVDFRQLLVDGSGVAGDGVAAGAATAEGEAEAEAEEHRVPQLKLKSLAVGEAPPP